MVNKIAIINCDTHEDLDTNGSFLLNQILPNAKIIHYCKGQIVKNVLEYDKYIITGSHAHFDNDFYWISNLKELIKQIHKHKTPCLAICFGMQVVADLFGGKVEKNKIPELGFKEVEITNELISHDFFNNLPRSYKVYQYHKDMVTTIPFNAKLCLINDCCIQGFLFDNFFCVQFHPEVTPLIAKKMAERDNEDINQIMNNTSLSYDLHKNIILNFVEVQKNE